MTRTDGRRSNELRPLAIKRGYLKNAEGSALIEMGGTRVICAATVEDRVPPFLRNSGRGWVTAEYSMLPRSSHERITREVTRGHVGGRTHEIQRLIGRSLRAVTNLEALGERQILIDCDVLEADGGTRTASITGAFVALADAIRWLTRRVELPGAPLRDFIAAVSVGIVGETPMLDLCYEEDSKAEVDMNLVMTGSGNLVEIQGTAEGKPFSEKELAQMMDLGKQGIRKLITQQKRTLGLRALPQGVDVIAGVDLIVLATTNQGKAKELERLLAGTAKRFETLRDHPGIALPPERGGNYRENAFAKARAVNEALGVPAVGDDSGLEVDSLGGAPGLYSARFAGEGAGDTANNAKLLAALKDVPEAKRTARFHCALVLVRGADDALEADGFCEGVILAAPRGDHGFGYDPLFLPDGETLTFGELPAARKDSISHRARAAAVLSRAIRHGD